MIKRAIRKIIGSGNAAPGVGTYNERTRVNWLKKVLAGIPEGSRILDAGAGEQQFKKFCTHLNYVSQDFAQYKPEELNKGLQVGKWDYGKLDIVSDIASIPEPDDSFDAIMCTEVFEHIINPLEAMKEFSRLTKKGGFLILTAPFCSLTHFAPYHFYSGFNKYFYDNVLRENGFKLMEMEQNGNYFEYIAQELRRVSSVAEKYSPGVTMTNNEKKQIEKSLSILERFSKNDKGSSEMLCFGFHIFAQKL